MVWRAIVINLLNEFKEHIASLTKESTLKRVWMTSFNLDTCFFESFLLPVIVSADPPKSVMDYEILQTRYQEQDIDLHLFCDARAVDVNDKKTTVPVHTIIPRDFPSSQFQEDSLFHSKVIYLENNKGEALLGAGSANLTLSGWARNSEVFTFNRVSTTDQRESIEKFFKPLFRSVNLDRTLQDVSVENSDSAWFFKQSFAGDSFIKTMLADKTDNLLVWSPYFPKNLSGFIDKINEHFPNTGVRFTLVPDLIAGERMRTEWTENLQKKIDTGSVSFYTDGIDRGEADFCHAKLWKSDSQIAVGSWNFTAPGSNCGDLWNIEAGIVYPDTSACSILGDKLTITRNSFCSESELEKESLQLNELLPFSVAVIFNWEDSQYTVSVSRDIPKGYSIKLPDVSDIKALHTSFKRDIFPPREIMLNHTYTIYKDTELVYQGVIFEIFPQYRRTQEYDSLNDLFQDLINGIDLNSSSNTSSKTFDTIGNEIVNIADEWSARESETTSYFKMFNAAEFYKKRFQNMADYKDVEAHLFKYPGSLLEIYEKLKTISQEKVSVYNWFLFQEFIQIREAARRKLLELNIPGDTFQSPKWQKLLSIETPKLTTSQEEQLSAYAQMIQKECGYVP
jgi:hypothetical protein